MGKKPPQRLAHIEHGLNFLQVQKFTKIKQQVKRVICQISKNVALLKIIKYPIRI